MITAQYRYPACARPRVPLSFSRAARLLPVDARPFCSPRPVEAEAQREEATGLCFFSLYVLRASSFSKARKANGLISAPSPSPRRGLCLASTAAPQPAWAGPLTTGASSPRSPLAPAGTGHASGVAQAIGTLDHRRFHSRAAGTRPAGAQRRGVGLPPPLPPPGVEGEKRPRRCPKGGIRARLVSW